MREAKYRAYHRRTKEKINVDFIDTKYKVIGEYDFRNNQRFYPINEFELVQYTGLKDRYKEEIYERDVVVDIIGTRYEVRFNEFCAFMLYPIRNEEQFMAIYPDIELQVVGNIYENPELLEVE